MSPEELDALMPLTAKFDLPEAQRKEIVKTIWGLMESVVDQAWGIDVGKYSRGKLEDNSLQSHDDTILSDEPAVKIEFKSSSNQNQGDKHAK